MNFDFTEEQKLFAEAVRKFALAELEAGALQRAHNPRFPFDVAQRMGRQGLMGITLPEADGGQGGSLMDAVIAIEQAALVCPLSADVVQSGVAVIQPDVSQAGGISELRRIAAMAETYDVTVAPHCPLGTGYNLAMVPGTVA